MDADSQAGLEALVKQWRRQSEPVTGQCAGPMTWGERQTLRQCAEQLEALLMLDAPPAPAEHGLRDGLILRNGGTIDFAPPAPGDKEGWRSWYMGEWIPSEDCDDG